VIPGRVGPVLRTVRHLHARQVLAQVVYMGRRGVAPVEIGTGAPALALRRASAPFLGAPAHARWDGASRVVLIGNEISFPDAIDWDVQSAGPLWAYHLHQFDYARDARHTAAARSALLLDWIARHPRGQGWNPHPISLRTLSWGKLLLEPGLLALDEAASDRIRHSLACQVETLDRNLETRLQANHLFSNLLAVVFAGLLFRGERADRWLRRARWLRREIAAQILPDGLHVERSPMYHALLLENVLDLLNLARAAGDRAPGALRQDLEQCAARMLGALRALTHPDGRIALFADSAFDIAHEPASLERYATSLGVEARPPERDGVLEAGGYVRLVSGPFSLIASVAGPMPSYQPGHAHCDALAFELCVAGERVVTDTGVFEYVPGARRETARATRSHATLTVGGQEQAEVWSAHRIGGRPRVVLERVLPGKSADARCSGWATPETVHHRRFEVASDGVAIHDRTTGLPRPVRYTLPLAPGLEPRLVQEADGSAAARIGLASGDELRLSLPTGVAFRVASMPYFPGFGVEIERACLVGEAETLARASLEVALV